MGDSRLTDNAGNDGVKLETMCKDSFSWHPCLVSLRSTGLGLIVKYEDTYFEEIIADKKGVLARIRVRSSPLQGDDCSSIQQGDLVLATKNKDIFYDGRVEQAIRVRHSKRTHCRCSFTVKWLHRALEGEAMILPANAIMKLSTKNINVHPTISAFFSMEEASTAVDTLPFSTTVDGMDWERDISQLLEKQIKEISNLIDAPGKTVPQNILLGLEVDATRQNHDKATDASFENLYIITPSVSNLKGSTRNQNKHSLVTTMEKEKSPAHITSFQEELAGSRLPLNPLAARAALASLRSKFPQNAELSSLSCEFSLNMPTTLEGKNPQYEGIVKTLFPNPNAFQIAQLSNEPSKAQAKGAEKKKKNSEKKVIYPSETRVTCGQTQRTSKMQESAQMTDTEGEQLRSSSKTRRVTRSIVNGTGIIELEESKKAIDDNMSTKPAKLESDAQCFTSPRNCLSDNKKAIASPTDIKMNAPAEIGKSFLGEDGLVIEVDPLQCSFVEEAEKLHTPKRVTRSAAREGAEKNKFLPEPQLRKRKSCESSESKLEDNGILKSNSSELKKSIIPLGAAKISAQCTKEREETTPDTPEKFVGCSSKGTKKKSAKSKTRETRSSPRLSSFRRTRSQTGA